MGKLRPQPDVALLGAGRTHGFAIASTLQHPPCMKPNWNQVGSSPDAF